MHYLLDVETSTKEREFRKTGKNFKRDQNVENLVQSIFQRRIFEEKAQSL